MWVVCNLCWIWVVHNPFLSSLRASFTWVYLQTTNLQLVLTPNCLTSSSQAHKIPIHSFLELQNKHTKTHKTGQGTMRSAYWQDEERVVSLDYEPKYASTGCPWGPPPLSLWNDCLWIQRLVGSDCSLKSTSWNFTLLLPTAIHPSPHLANPFWYIRVIGKERKKHSTRNREFGHTWVRFKNNIQKTPKTLSFGGKVSFFILSFLFPERVCYTWFLFPILWCSQEVVAIVSNVIFAKFGHLY